MRYTIHPELPCTRRSALHLARGVLPRFFWHGCRVELPATTGMGLRVLCGGDFDELLGGVDQPLPPLPPLPFPPRNPAPEPGPVMPPPRRKPGAEPKPDDK